MMQYMALPYNKDIYDNLKSNDAVLFCIWGSDSNLSWVESFNEWKVHYKLIWIKS